MIGPGKYDDECKMLRLGTKAEAVIVIVINGRDGSGFSMQAKLPLDVDLPQLLEDVAAQMRKDMAPRQ